MAGTIKKDIGGVSYESSPFPPFDWLLMSGRLAKTLGPSLLGILINAVTSGGVRDILSQDSAALLPTLQSALSGLSPKEFQLLCTDLMRSTWQGPTPKREGQLQLDSERNFNLAFLDDYSAIWSVLWLALEANDFFVGGGIGKRLRAKLTPPVSPASSTPTSSMS